MVRRTHDDMEEIPAISVPTDPSQNPYYVHPNESGTAALVSPLLDGKNYHSWSRSMMKAVIMKNKLRFLDGSCSKPDPLHPTYEPWLRCNNLVLSWLMNSVIPAISQSLVYIDTASQAWEDLKARFARADRGFWEELELYRPVPDCTCTFSCMCEAMRNAKKFKEEDLVLLFLTGLNDHYAMHESLNGLETINDSLDNSASINFSRKLYGKSPASSKNDKMCTYCHKTNHIMDNCFKKHGFPPGYRFKDGTLAVSRHQGQSSANHVASEAHGVNNAVDNRVATFSSEEYQALMALLRSNTNNAGEGPSQVNSITKVIASSYCNDKQGIGLTPLNTWILDSGATDHICASLSLFTTYRQVKDIPVKLPNGNTVIADIVGDISIT
ncbi:retrovirus-related pol polyprotein from transposon TNT 1-94, partial [Trifolium medium]|nr:retrovirus-related pol polyprotein from transposon TNT 1-94 [Trifolium medium]